MEDFSPLVLPRINHYLEAENFIEITPELRISLDSINRVIILTRSDFERSKLFRRGNSILAERLDLFLQEKAKTGAVKNNLRRAELAKIHLDRSSKTYTWALNRYTVTKANCNEVRAFLIKHSTQHKSNVLECLVEEARLVTVKLELLLQNATPEQREAVQLLYDDAQAQFKSISASFEYSDSLA